MPSSSRRLPLSALRTFEVAARLLSFKAAAEELRVSATTVSNQIRQLEQDGGFTLFVRKTRHVVLTDTGRSLAQVVARAFGDIRTEFESYGVTSRKTVTLAVGPIFATRWLVPRLARFRAANPNINLVLHHSPRITGVEHLSSMIAVDWGIGPWTGLLASHLLDIEYAPVLSPGLLHYRGPIETPADLARFPIIHQNDRGEWHAWVKLAGFPLLRFPQETVIVDSNVVTQAAIDGLGVALGSFPFLQQEIEAGRLVCPFDLRLQPTRSYFVLTRPGARTVPEVARVFDWLLAEAGQRL